MVELRTPAEIGAMQASGRVVAHALEAVRAAATVGTRLSHLDEVARRVIFGAGASSPFLGYRPAFAPEPSTTGITRAPTRVAGHGRGRECGVA